jgi:hypothetical protein
MRASRSAVAGAKHNMFAGKYHYHAGLIESQNMYYTSITAEQVSASAMAMFISVTLHFTQCFAMLSNVC